MNHITNYCRCGKVFGLDEQDARRIVRRIQKLKGDTAPVRYYACTYGAWHWTSQIDQQKRAS